MRGKDTRQPARPLASTRPSEPERPSGPAPPANPLMERATAECRKIRARRAGRKPVVRLARPRPTRHRGILFAARGGRGAPRLGTPTFERRPDPR